MKRAWLIALLVSCAGTHTVTTIQTPQDYERVVVEVIDRVIEIFRDGGINCQMVSGELRTLNGSQKVDAAKRWKKEHPEASDTMKAQIAARKADLDKAMAPTARQCEGPIGGLVRELTQ